MVFYNTKVKTLQEVIMMLQWLEDDFHRRNKNKIKSLVDEILDLK